MKKSELRQMIREVLKEELGHDSITSDTIKKLALYKKVNIIPEQGPRQHYNRKLKITTSWTDFQDTLLAEHEEEMNELLEYSDIPFEDLEEYLTPDVGWLGIRSLIDKANSGDNITLLEIDYDDLGVSWSGTTEYYIVIL